MYWFKFSGCVNRVGCKARCVDFLKKVRRWGLEWKWCCCGKLQKKNSRKFQDSESNTRLEKIISVLKHLLEEELYFFEILLVNENPFSTHKITKIKRFEPGAISYWLWVFCFLCCYENSITDNFFITLFILWIQ